MILSFSKDVEEQKVSYIASRDENVTIALENKFGSFLKIKTYLPYCSSVGKESACNIGDPGSIPGLGISPGKGNGNPLQYTCLENPMDGGAWRATIHGVIRVGHELAIKPPPPYHSAIPLLDMFICMFISRSFI